MTILYEGFEGREPSIALGVVLLILGLVSLISLIVSLKERDSGCAIISFIIIFLAIGATLVNITSQRYSIVRATIDNTVSFKEVYENYELIDVEGNIYTFRVKGE